jgi:hypothetical protein
MDPTPIATGTADWMRCNSHNCRRISGFLMRPENSPPRAPMDFRALSPQRPRDIGLCHLSSFVNRLASNRLNGSRGFVRDIPGEHSPGDTSILVGERHSRDVRMPALPKARQPGASRILLSQEQRERRGSSRYAKAIAAFADPTSCDSHCSEGKPHSPGIVFQAGPTLSSSRSRFAAIRSDVEKPSVNLA